MPETEQQPAVDVQSEIEEPKKEYPIKLDVFTRMQSGDQKARGEFMETVRREFLKSANRLLRDTDAAEDLASEALIKVMENINKFQKTDDERALNSWLNHLFYNLANDQFRTKSRHPLLTNQEDEEGESLLEKIPSGEDVSETALNNLQGPNDLGERVNQAVSELPPHQREPIKLHYADSKTLEEIAELTGVKVGTVKSRLSRGRERLTRKLGGAMAELLENPNFRFVDKEKKDLN